MGTRILITGATGGSGSYQIKNILKNYGQRYELHATKRPRSSLELIDPECRGAITFYDRDVTDPLAVTDLLSQIEPQIILHYAADTYIPPSSDNPELYICENSKMVLNILNAVRVIRRYKKDYDPVIFIPSSLEVYGTQFTDEAEYRRQLAVKRCIWPPPRYKDGKFVSEIPMREDNPLRPASPYAIGKCAIENIARLNYCEYGIKTVILRCCNQTGPGRLPNFAETNFALQTALILAGYLPPLIMYGNSKAVRDFLDYRDAVRAHFALVLCALDGKVEFGSPVNLGSGRSRSIGEVLDFYISRAREKGKEIKAEADPKRIRVIEVLTIMPDIAKLREITGWKPEIPLERTLEDIFTYWSRRVEKDGKNLLYLI